MRHLADLAEIRGDEPAARSLRRAAESVEVRGPEAAALIELAREGKLTSIEGINEVAAEYIRSIRALGPEASIEAAVRAIPRDLSRLLLVAGLEIGQIAELHRRFGTTTAGDLSCLLTEGLLRKVPGFDEDVREALARGLWRLRSDDERIPLGRAYSVVTPVLAELRARAPGFSLLTPVGSLRRFKPTVANIELLAVADDPAPVIDCFTHLSTAVHVPYQGHHKASITVQTTQVDLRVVPPEEQGPALVHYTGSIGHNLELREHAAARGLVLGPAMLVDQKSGSALPVREEQDVYSALGLLFIAPELRRGAGEIEAAAQGRLPALVAQADIRGDLHMHSTWSDGRDSIESMVRTSLELGYEYVAITDHSRSSGASRSLIEDDVWRQAQEIDQVRRLVPGIEILHGCEVDILADGSLDFPDAVLERLDVVLASLHHSAGQTGDQLTDRYVAAMHHPLVNIITHPTNRLVGRRSGYDLDFDRLFEVAIETGTALEIDGAPVHLDMDGALARRAVSAGVTVVIDSDCHRATALKDQMMFGLATARRGWVEARHVLNTRPVVEVRDMLQRKRRTAGRRAK